MLKRKSNGRIAKGGHWREPKPHWQREWLYYHYAILKKSALEIAEQMNCRDTNIYYWLHKHGIHVRSMSEARAVKHWGLTGTDNPMWNKKGEAHPNWLGGITPERQVFYASHKWKKVCQQVYKRDEAKCQRCGLKRETIDMPFHIHHITSFQNKELRVDPNNLVVLCEVCHHFVHSKHNVTGIFLTRQYKWQIK